MKFAPAPSNYSQTEQNQFRGQLERELTNMLRSDQDAELVTTRIILRSPNGSRFALTVSNAGALSATAL
jgi:hypothetical protein